MTPDVRQTDLPAIKQMIDEGDITTAGEALNLYVTKWMGDPLGWFLLARCMVETDKPALAAVILRDMIQNHPPRWEWFERLGKAYMMMHMWEEAEGCFRHILKEDPENPLAMLCMSTLCVQMYKSDEVIEWADKALERMPGLDHAYCNKGFAYLQKRDYAKGWDYWEHGLGNLKWRDERNYVGEPRWTGRLGKNVHIVVYSDQGLGDQIAGVEPLHELCEKCTVTALDVDPKLRGLFARSFPEIPVHGDAKKTELEWDPMPRIDFNCNLYTMHKYLRLTESNYSKQPFLTADPQRRLMYGALLEALGPEAKVGIAWSGGAWHTHSEQRTAPLDALLPILKQDAHFVSLEYKDRADQVAEFADRKGITIHEFPGITCSSDYEDQAALVAELDMVISVPTAIVHLAGALGVPTLCMVNPTPNVHYAGFGDTMPYYGSVTLLRMDKANRWVEVVNAAADTLKEFLDGKA